MKNLNESGSEGSISQQGGAGEGEYQPSGGGYNLTDGDNINRINASLYELSMGTYVNPITPVIAAYNRLSTIGITFDHKLIRPDIREEESTLRAALTQFGGTFDPYTGETSNNVNGKILEFNFKNHSGEYSVGISIMDDDNGAA